MNEREHWHQICATFSVKDHVREGAFIAEVLLYDYLYIPTCAGTADGLSREDAAQERARWVQQGWDPAKQTQLVARLGNGPLGDRVIPIAWAPALQENWKKRMATDALISDKLRQAKADGYAMTGDVLQQLAPAALKTVSAVASCNSLADLEQRTEVRAGHPPDRVEGNVLMAVLGHELFVPDEPEANDYELLDLAAAVAAEDSYREKRAALYRWHARFLADGKTDAPSIRMALEEMQTLLEELKAHTGWTKTRHIAFFGAIAAALAAPFAPVAAAVGQATASIGQYWSQAKASDLANRDKEDALLAAALVAGAQAGLR